MNNQKIELHILDKDLNEISLGKQDIDKVMEYVYEYAKNSGKHFDNGDDAIANTSFNISKDNNDFLRIDFHSEDEVHFSSDRCIYKMSRIKKFFTSDNTMQFKISLNKAPEIIKNYFDISREDFEDKYKVSYQKSSSIKYVKL